MNSFLSLLLLLAAGVCCCSAYNCTSYPCLIFEDNFDKLDFNKWEHEISAWGGGNFEFQYYDNNRRNSFVKDGKLYIKPTLTEEQYGEDFVRDGTMDLWGANPANLCTGHQYGGCKVVASGRQIIPPVASARLRSVRGFSFRYGRIEVEAKMPTGDWLWPAIWMLPTNNEYGPWPSSGEIDVVESRGNRNYSNAQGGSAGVDEMGMTVHFGPKRPFNGWPTAHVTRRKTDGKTFGDTFHKYRIDWSEAEGLKYYLDDEHMMTVNPPAGGFWEQAKDFWGGLDEQTWSPWLREKGGTKMSPFDKDFYIIFNVAVGGTAYFPDEFRNHPYPKPWKNADDPRDAMKKFYEAKDLWLPTWKEEKDTSTAMVINYIRVWKLERDF